MNFLKYKIREKIKDCPLSPDSEEDLEKVKEIRKYLGKFVNLDADYDFDDQDSENIYKAIKRLRLSKDKYDKVGYIVFNFIFDENIMNQIESRYLLWQ